MTETATIQPMPRPRGNLDDEQKRLLDEFREKAEDWQEAYRDLVVTVLGEGASFSEVSKFTGLSTNTLQRWKREAGR